MKQFGFSGSALKYFVLSTKYLELHYSHIIFKHIAIKHFFDKIQVKIKFCRNIAIYLSEFYSFIHGKYPNSGVPTLYNRILYTDTLN